MYFFNLRDEGIKRLSSIRWCGLVSTRCVELKIIQNGLAIPMVSYAERSQEIFSEWLIGIPM